MDITTHLLSYFDRKWNRSAGLKTKTQFDRGVPGGVLRPHRFRWDLHRFVPSVSIGSSRMPSISPCGNMVIERFLASYQEPPAEKGAIWRQRESEEEREMGRERRGGLFLGRRWGCSWNKRRYLSRVGGSWAGSWKTSGGNENFEGMLSRRQVNN